MSKEPWKVYYWPPEVLQGGSGRSEFVKLVLEEAGVPYKMVHEKTYELFKGGQWQGYPAFAVPLIQRGKQSYMYTSDFLLLIFFKSIFFSFLLWRVRACVRACVRVCVCVCV